MKHRGFTVIELLVVIVLFVALGTVFAVQTRDAAAAQRDEQRKRDINALYYYLEEIAYARTVSYPQKLDNTTIIGLDPSSFTDPDSKLINEPGGTYHYEPQDCEQAACKSYTLRADLEREADFIKQSRH
jgi:general secretion pathway protein G